MASVKEQCADAKLIVVICDTEGGLIPENEIFDMVNIKDLDVDDFAEFVFRYNILELNTAVKPFAFAKFIAEGYSNVIYFDPDIRVFSTLDDMCAVISQNNVVLTPHLTGELDDGMRPNEVDILRAGTYNLGYIGVNNSDESVKFLDWWMRRLRTLCVNDVARGLFVDQKWMELAPSLFEGVYINQNSGWNVAYWNLNHRQISKGENGQYLVNSAPLVFIHYSGFKHKDNILSIHQNRFDFDNCGDVVSELFKLYSSELFANDADDVSNIEYGYGKYADGSSLPNFLRETYLSLEDSLAEPPVFALDAPSSWLVELMNTPAQSSNGLKTPFVTLLAHKLYTSRQDLQVAFPDVFGTDSRAFAGWFVASAGKEYGLSPLFTASVLEAIESESTEQKPKKGNLGRTIFLKVHSNPKLLKLVGYLPGKNLRTRLKHKLLGQVNVVPPATAEIISSSKLVANDGVNVIGYLHAESGTGEAARSTIRACNATSLKLVGVDVRNNNISRMEESPEIEVSKETKYDINIFHINADQTPDVFNSLDARNHQGRYNIGFWFWELEDLPIEYLSSYSYLDEIWVASTFCQDAISKHANIPVTLIPLCVDLATENLISKKELDLPEESFLILSIIDMLSIPERKNPFGVLEAFDKLCVTQKENAHLVLKLSNLDRCSNEIKQKVQSYIDRLPVTLIDRYLKRSELISLMAASDCYFSMHRSEGFGLPLAEAMFLGVPVVATGWSSNMDFMTLNNSYPIKYDLVELDQDYGPYKKGSIWADPDVGHAASCLLEIMTQPQSAQQKILRALSDIKQFNSPESVGKRIKSRVDLISSRASKL